MFSSSGRQAFQVILTGAIGVGKTSLVNRLLPFVKSKVTGFRTLPVYQDQVKIGYSLQPLEAEEVCFARHNPATDSYEIALEVFEHYGWATLQAALASDGLILMDELGVFEQEAINFCRLVKSILGGERDYLVVIQQRALAFWLNGLIKKKFDLYEVTPASREGIYNHLAALLQAS